ncbi:MAG: LysE family translocator [Magnetospirillum sp.]
MEISLFILALLAAYALPGPDMVLLLQACGGGLRPAISTALGLALARALHVLLAGLGLAAVLRTSPHAFTIIQVTGGLYLGWLGWRVLRAAGRVPAQTALPTGRLQRSLLRGFVTNLTNPKALLFCSMLLPQFITPQNGGIGSQFTLLGLILVAVGLGWDALVIGAGNRLNHLSRRHPGAETALHRGFGLLMLGFALRLVFYQAL